MSESRFSLAGPNRPAPNGDEIKAVRAIRATTIGSLLAVFAAMLLASMATSGAGAGIVFVLGAALAAAGFIVGVLFSMPRALAVADDIGHAKKTTPETIDTPETQPRVALYSINTNLEQVSDWLTKIIVGVGLVEAQRIATFVWQSATTLGGELNDAQRSLDADSAAALALGMIIGFPLVGFLIGFFSVRLYISRAVYATDKDILRPVSYSASTKTAVDQEWMRKNEVPADAPAELTESVEPSSVDPSPAVLTALNTPLDRLRLPSDLVTRGRAALLRGKFEEAIAAFALALQKGESDPAVLLDYARALMGRSRKPWKQIVDVLQDARLRLDTTVPSEIRRQIVWELVNAYLYTDPPDGFTKAIALADDYTTKDGRDDPYGYVYLAAAHGQAYSYWKNRDGARADAEVTSVREAIRQALDAGRKKGIEDGIKRWLQSLATSGSEDDDLKDCINDHPEVAADLGLGVPKDEK